MNAGEPAFSTAGCRPAEAALIGCLLRMPHRDVAAYLGQVSPEDLTDPRFRLVLSAITRLVSRPEPVDPDPVLVLGELRRSGDDSSFLDDQGAGNILADLYESAPATGSVGHYLCIVREHAWRRRVMETGVRLQQMAGKVPLVDLAQAVLDELQSAARAAQPTAAPVGVA